ncbi:hypothetical protein [Lewinella sp. LCG006]|uniref:hypothetical protein n=1 Tax=Lewinella sp. LCG006 TaxID=3231911 RepID=UPI00345F3F22
MNKSIWLLSTIAIVYLFVACETPPSESTASLKTATTSLSAPTSSLVSPFTNSTNTLDKYWYQGKGELNVYSLEQNRYQDIHPGEALLVFVTEDFLTDRQVKNDRYESANSTPILKMNGITRFTTGLYDYSIMTSVFTPVKTRDFPRTLKVTHSAQDWCGQVFSQINLKGEEYQYQQFSYFESEGDDQKNASANLLEEELMNRIRMDYQRLPVGEDLKFIPGLTFLRLKHKPYQTYTATASLKDYEGADFTGEKLKAYVLEYPEFQRTLTIVFSSVAPFYIEGWLDSYPSVFDGKMRTTKALRSNTVLLDYWSKNANTTANAELREQLNWR